MCGNVLNDAQAQPGRGFMTTHQAVQSPLLCCRGCDRPGRARGAGLFARGRDVAAVVQEEQLSGWVFKPPRGRWHSCSCSTGSGWASLGAAWRRALELCLCGPRAAWRGRLRWESAGTLQGVLAVSVTHQRTPSAAEGASGK